MLLLNINTKIYQFYLISDYLLKIESNKEVQNEIVHHMNNNPFSHIYSQEKRKLIGKIYNFMYEFLKHLLVSV